VDAAAYYVELATAYVRGACPEFAHLEDGELLAAGRTAGLRLHRFKRTAVLPRVRRVLGALRTLGATHVVDLGSGRGAFLWPLLDELPHTRVTAVDCLHHRVATIGAVRRGGFDRLAAARMDAARLGLADGVADVVTVLEVLEHVTEPARVAAEAVRVARRAVIASVPSKRDDNPEHVRLFDARSLTALLEQAGAARVDVEHVPKHMVAIGRL
jgi:2-polyprenyl-3-methyl-5-hydroxy-6-metoxy-1,4-benzoquinol methylase